MRQHLVILTCCLTGLMLSCLSGPSNTMPVSAAKELHDNWLLIAKSDVPDLTPLHQAGWHSDSARSIPVPATVFGALADLGEYADPFFGQRLREIDKTPFQQPWIYRTEFDLDTTRPRDHVDLLLEGFNFRANVWLNGHKIADADTLVGPFRMYTLDVAETVQDQDNVLLIEIIRPAKDDLTIGWVDWNPYPPDDNIGLWRPVKIHQSGIVTLRDMFVQTNIDVEGDQSADVTLSAWIENHSRETVSGRIKGKVAGRPVSVDYKLAGGERRKAVMTSASHPVLHFDKPKLWWPHLMGDQPLFHADLSIMVDDAVSDHETVRFGFREVDDYINEQGHRGWTVNGKKVLIKGGGWVDDLFLREDIGKVRSQLEYACHMNLNTIRLEGFWGSSQAIYDICDELGLMLMIGWSCHWEWEGYVNRPTDQYLLIKGEEETAFHAQSYRDQVVWGRNHPSILMWVFGSDMIPRPELEHALYEYLDDVDPTRPRLAGCRQTAFGGSHDYTSTISGPVAVKMVGPYSYVTPNYWYVDKNLGGAFGFNTETGPGHQPVVLESLKKFTPADKLWPLNETWDFHCGRSVFASMQSWLKPFDARYGRGSSVEEFCRKAQAANYEAIRPMFEAFSVNKPVATGVIQWMFNSSWPTHLWQFFDYYLMPTGAFYGTRKACQPLNLVYNYGDHRVYLTNDYLDKYSELSAEIKVMDTESKVVMETVLPVEADAQSTQNILSIPANLAIENVYFLDLRLKDSRGQTISSNFYWLSKKEDVLDFKNSDWHITPNTSYADFSALNQLPATEVEANAKYSGDGDDQICEVTLENRGDKLAFFIELAVKGSQDGLTILPVFWDDNYISLLPGEKRTVMARYKTADLHGQEPVFSYNGFNLSR